jgi:DNA-binding XRE family transcriptional regulator
MTEVFQTPNDLWVRVQVALELTQAALADLVGVERRTIQRWQGRGAVEAAFRTAKA